MRIKKIFVATAIMLLTSNYGVLAQRSDKLPPINVKEYSLKNGLKVLLHEDKSTPVVSVGVWYHVGAKNEVEGRTGFAHLFEHMMFQGSKNYDADYFTPLQEAGASINGTTNQDRTWYFETVPSNFLELALFMESDRMGNLLPAMTQQKLDNQRDVVKNERRQRVDNQPYGTAFEKIGAIMFPKPHPYNWTTIGSLEDLQAASMEDVQSFFRQYYTPNNTVLVLSGDFDEKQARGWIEKYFGWMPKGSDIKRPNPDQPKLDKEIRMTVEDSVPLPRRYMIWHGVRAYAPDEPALDFLSSILSNGRTSRLQSNLLYGKELVQQVGANNGTNEIAGLFQILATARPGKNLDDIEKEIDGEIDRIKKAPPSEEEMARALNTIESQTIFGLQTVLGKASQLAAFSGYLGKANWFQDDLDRYRKVTPADVSRVANQYLTANRLVMTYVPGTRETPRSRREADQTTTGKTEKPDEAKIAAQAAALPKPGPDPKFSTPPIEKTKLSNGLEVWMVEHRELPIVSMNMVFKTGTVNEPDDRFGVADMAASLLDDGTKTRSAEDLANQLRQIGVSGINAGSNWDSSNVSIQTLTKNLDKALEIYADVVQNPAFPAKELESVRARALVGLRQQRSNPNAISNVAYNKVLYGDHPYGRDNNEESIKAITRDDLIKFYEANYRPNNATLIVVGDYNKSDLKAKLEKAFAGWKAASVPAKSLPKVEPLEKTQIYLVDRPNSAQSVVSIGHVGIDRMHRDYFPVLVMNTILGGGFTSRINMNLREDKGYTYGARSGFSFRRGAGPFTAGGDVQTAVTKESIQEFMNELNAIRGTRPVTARELNYNKQSLIRRYPAAFETIGGMSNQLATLVTYGLPDTYFNEYIAKVNAVSLADVNRVAKTYLDPSKMAIVIVGDRRVIEPGLKELGYSIILLDAQGNPIAG
ncbi:MAG: M16 family metallopeptidase [Pyrinomonadaceae bacterium]